MEGRLTWGKKGWRIRQSWVAIIDPFSKWFLQFVFFWNVSFCWVSPIHWPNEKLSWPRLAECWDFPLFQKCRPCGGMGSVLRIGGCWASHWYFDASLQSHGTNNLLDLDHVACFIDLLSTRFDASDFSAVEKESPKWTAGLLLWGCQFWCLFGRFTSSIMYIQTDL